MNDYLVLKQMSLAAGVSMAETLHKIIDRQGHEAPISGTQILIKVHHKGIRYGDDIRNKSDNLEDNLEVGGSLGEHSKLHAKGYEDGYAKGLIDGRIKQIQELKEEIRVLKGER